MRPGTWCVASASASSVGRLHALWTLDGLNRLDDSLIGRALDDAEPEIRQNAIVLAESRLAASPALTAKLIDMFNDPSDKVRFQLLCTLGFVNSSAAQTARDSLLALGMEDRWVQLAALSASSEEAPRLFQKALKGLARGIKRPGQSVAADLFGDRSAEEKRRGPGGLVQSRRRNEPGISLVAHGESKVWRRPHAENVPVRMLSARCC